MSGAPLRAQMCGSFALVVPPSDSLAPARPLRVPEWLVGSCWPPRRTVLGGRRGGLAASRRQLR
eukprot:8977342-Alexandrium_andersonii.AAC.1